MMDIALSGIQASFTRMAVSAHNVANVNTDGYRAYRVIQTGQPNAGVQTQVEQSDEPTDLVHETLEQMNAGYAVKANVLTLKTANRMQGYLMDILA